MVRLTKSGVIVSHVILENIGISDVSAILGNSTELTDSSGNTISDSSGEKILLMNKHKYNEVSDPVAQKYISGLNLDNLMLTNQAAKIGDTFIVSEDFIEW